MTARGVDHGGRATRIGVVFLPQFPPERLRGIALAADEAGLDELWLWEDCFRESGIASAAAVLAWTKRLRVGIGLLPVPLRNVALTAMEAATLHRMFPQRVTLGVGHGVLDWMAQVGARVESPVTLLREYLDALRALLNGELVTVSGRYVVLDRVALDWPPQPAPLVYAGASGPRSLRLTGQHADGTIVHGGISPDRLREMIKLIDEGRVAGQRTKPRRIVSYVHAAIGPTAAERLETERRRWGYPTMGDLAATGDASAVAEAVWRWAGAGADTVVLQPTPDDPDPEGFVRFVAGQVQPLLR
ncbi:MAG: LLM class flavin-dependent oxidoreductase [Micromonosporaceae bacterium]|nr:LLM class flavin-dependent oxidoreductase [Micromonosporaceae bacterium]